MLGISFDDRDGSGQKGCQGFRWRVESNTADAENAGIGLEGWEEVVVGNLFVNINEVSPVILCQLSDLLSCVPLRAFTDVMGAEGVERSAAQVNRRHLPEGLLVMMVAISVDAAQGNRRYLIQEDVRVFSVSMQQQRIIHELQQTQVKF